MKTYKLTYNKFRTTIGNSTSIGTERREMILVVFSHPQTILIAICRYPQRSRNNKKRKRGKIKGKGKGRRDTLDEFTVNQNGRRNGINMY